MRKKANIERGNIDEIEMRNRGDLEEVLSNGQMDGGCVDDNEVNAIDIRAIGAEKETETNDEIKWETFQYGDLIVNSLPRCGKYSLLLTAVLFYISLFLAHVLKDQYLKIFWAV